MRHWRSLLSRRIGGRLYESSVIDDSTDEVDLILQVVLTEISEESAHARESSRSSGNSVVIEYEAEIFGNVSSVGLVEEREVQFDEFSCRRDTRCESSEVDEDVVESRLGRGGR